MAKIAEVTRKFFVASMFMWIFPFAILYGFQHDWFPGFSHISPHSQTLLSGIFAVISVNVMLAFYIYMAMKEPSGKHEPDPAFVAQAKAKAKASPSKPSSGDKQD